MYLLLIEIAIRADLVSNSNAFHINDLGTGELISVLDWTLANLLVTDRIVNSVLNGGLALRF